MSKNMETRRELDMNTETAKLFLDALIKEVETGLAEQRCRFILGDLKLLRKMLDQPVCPYGLRSRENGR